ncbi:hypothetical protein SEA_BILLNYE_194 [Streptomyces phage BillNye]|uniref:Uncharacterized protein n=2 Tax=Wilnyevirus billnye TaxID=2560486 RepID=A0A2L1IW20_9CAUD|nr:hypothetical protein FDJ30_gp067 [Streptomyces phage BillNye]AVD99366.1 hypothetical protein SEA_BILLNYE_194 [Streptomyces phage BillNye]QBZ72449.1 hypothetical protein SEA_CIRCINUS_195 [Streptomyces phage Circinus]
MDIRTVRIAGYALLLCCAALLSAGNTALETDQTVLANFEFFIAMLCFTNGGMAIAMTNGIK